MTIPTPNPINGSILLAGESTTRPANSGVCKNHFKDLDILINGGNGRYLPDRFDYWIPVDKKNGYLVKPVNQRVAELLTDKNNLYGRRLEGENSYEGHQNALNAQKRAIADMVERIANDCDYSTMTKEQIELLDKAVDIVIQPTPDKPDRRIQSIVDQGPTYFIERGAKEIYDILVQAGTFTLATILAILAFIAASLGLSLQANASQLEAQGISVSLANDKQSDMSSDLTTQGDQQNTSPTTTKSDEDFKPSQSAQAKNTESDNKISRDNVYATMLTMFSSYEEAVAVMRNANPPLDEGKIQGLGEYVKRTGQEFTGAIIAQPTNQRQNNSWEYG